LFLHISRRVFITPVDLPEPATPSIKIVLKNLGTTALSKGALVTPLNNAPIRLPPEGCFLLTT